MDSVSKNGLKVFQFENVGFSGCIHGIFSRHGGVSSTPWKSLNQGGTVGDDRNHVYENRKRSFDFFDRKVDSIFDVWQVHGTNIVCTVKPRGLDEPHTKADAIFTDDPKITLFMRFADCVPIILFDPIKKVAGIIHAGWKGTVNNIVKEAIQMIKDVYGVDPRDLVAGIGPSIGPDHYIIADDVRKQVETAFDGFAKNLLFTSSGKIHFDLWQANEYFLQQQGVGSIECSRICTACNTGDWFSHRAENGATGRFGALIALKE